MRNAHDMSPGPARQLLGLTSARVCCIERDPLA